MIILDSLILGHEFRLDLFCSDYLFYSLSQDIDNIMYIQKYNFITMKCANNIYLSSRQSMQVG